VTNNAYFCKHHRKLLDSHKKLDDNKIHERTTVYWQSSAVGK